MLMSFFYEIGLFLAYINAYFKNKNYFLKVTDLLNTINTSVLEFMLI